ncbi:MAG TPA: hypothetical protein VLM89_06630 [Phycisphaerae bacterium]|nr:hypothetical protein [Phycisphaerae bacterium]
MLPEPASARAPTSVVVGIDEAGYGPLLGPLVVSAVAFDVPSDILKALSDPAVGPDLWALLRASVTAKRGKRDSRLAVADSKKLHGKGGDGDKAILLLERATLTFLSLAGKPPATLGGLLDRLSPGVRINLDACPWYQNLDLPLPIAASNADVSLQHNSLATDLLETGVRFRGAWSEVLPERQFNERVGATRNKAVVLFGLTARLMQRVADSVGPRSLRIWVDRQGGRTGYRRPLMRAFEGAELEILEERKERSGYVLKHAQASWAVRFVTGGESHHLPIALASIFSKYIRELLMVCFNRYWVARVPGLRPTAGYYADGQRFLADIGDVLRRDGLAREHLVRAL